MNLRKNTFELKTELINFLMEVFFFFSQKFIFPATFIFEATESTEKKVLGMKHERNLLKKNSETS